MTWRDQAACQGLATLFTATFFPSRRRGPSVTPQERAALAVCATCPVRQQCLDEELETMRLGAQSLGVFGGTTARQRADTLKAEGWRRIPRIKHGTTTGYNQHHAYRDVFGPPCAECREAWRQYAAGYAARQREGAAEIDSDVTDPCCNRETIEAENQVSPAALATLRGPAETPGGHDMSDDTRVAHVTRNGATD